MVRVLAVVLLLLELLELLEVLELLELVMVQGLVGAMIFRWVVCWRPLRRLH